MNHFVNPKYQKKTAGRFLRKLCYERIDRRTNRAEFIGSLWQSRGSKNELVLRI